MKKGWRVSLWGRPGSGHAMGRVRQGLAHLARSCKKIPGVDPGGSVANTHGAVCLLKLGSASATITVDDKPAVGQRRTISDLMASLAPRRSTRDL